MNAEPLLTLLSVLSINERYDNPSDQAIIAIANRYSEHTVHLFSLAPNLLSSRLIVSLNTPAILDSMSVNQQWVTDTYMILSHDVQPIIDLLRHTSFAFKRDTPWILGFGGSIKVKELNKLFRIFFNKGLLNVVAVTSERFYAYVYTYNPFSIGSNVNGCYNYSPIVIDVWNSHRFLHRAEMFPRTKVDDLQNCLVKTVIVPLPPYIMYSNKSAYPLAGIALELFRALSSKMNFTPDFSLLPTYALSVKELVTFPTTLAFGIPSQGGALAYGTVLTYKCFSWCAPTYVRHIRGWETLINTFSSKLWLIFMCSIIVTIVVTTLLVSFSVHESRIKRYPSWLIVWNIVFEVPLPTPKTAKFRFFFISFCLVCLVIGTVYKARLHVLMSSRPRAIKMSALSQVYSSKLDLLVSTELFWMLQTVQNESFYKTRIRPTDRSDPGWVEFNSDMLRKGTGTVLTSGDYCKVFAAKLGTTDEGYYKTYILPDCIMTVGGTGFAFSHESPFSKRVEKITSAMLESGMSRKYLMSSLPAEVMSSAKVVISLHDSLAIFSVLFLGLVASGFVFVAEICLDAKGR